MEVIRTAAGIRDACDQAGASGRSVGFVPTMGAFHGGHASLVRRARAEREEVVVSIFVNPSQFASIEDVASYPRDEPRDLRMAESLDVDVVFAPSQEQIQLAGSRGADFDPGPLAERLEGASRPGHFKGVATVVAKLFDLIGSCTAYFGEKDAQQLAMVRRMVVDLDLPVEVVACPTVRDRDGLALSSRNQLLTPEQRDAAACLFLALTEAAEMSRGGERDATKLVAVMAREIGATAEARLDYAAVVDESTLEEVREIEGPVRALVAARFGPIRLIDNLLLPT